MVCKTTIHLSGLLVAACLLRQSSGNTFRHSRVSPDPTPDERVALDKLLYRPAGRHHAHRHMSASPPSRNEGQKEILKEVAHETKAVINERTGETFSPNAGPAEHKQGKALAKQAIMATGRVKEGSILANVLDATPAPTPAPTKSRVDRLKDEAKKLAREQAKNLWDEAEAQQAQAQAHPEHNGSGRRRMRTDQASKQGASRRPSPPQPDRRREAKGGEHNAPMPPVHPGKEGASKSEAPVPPRSEISEGRDSEFEDAVRKGEEEKERSEAANLVMLGAEDEMAEADEGADLMMKGERDEKATGEKLTLSESKETQKPKAEEAETKPVESAPAAPKEEKEQLEPLEEEGPKDAEAAEGEATASQAAGAEAAEATSAGAAAADPRAAAFRAAGKVGMAGVKGAKEILTSAFNKRVKSLRDSNPEGAAEVEELLLGEPEEGTKAVEDALKDGEGQTFTDAAQKEKSGQQTSSSESKPRDMVAKGVKHIVGDSTKSQIQQLTSGQTSREAEVSKQATIESGKLIAAELAHPGSQMPPQPEDSDVE